MNEILAAALSALIFAHAAHAAPQSDAQFKAMDTDGDGKVSAAEHEAGARRMFEIMDADRDGKVTAREMTAAQGKISGKGQPPKGELSSADKIKVVDTNGDGVLSAAEHAAGSQAMFRKMDTDGDGFLSREEFDAGHAALLKRASK